MAGRNAQAIRELERIVARHTQQFEQVEGRADNLESEVQRIRDQSDSRHETTASHQVELRALDERVKQLERVRDLRWTLFVAIASSIVSAFLGILGTLFLTR